MIYLIRITLIIGLLSSSLRANSLYIQSLAGSVFVKDSATFKWQRQQGDVQVYDGTSFRTGRNFEGRALQADGEGITLEANTFFHLRAQGLFQERGGQWYKIAAGVSVQGKGAPIKGAPLGSKIGKFLPSSFVYATREGEFRRRKYNGQFQVLSGDILELPEFARGEMEWRDGTLLQFSHGATIEFGPDGLFLSQGSVFSTVRKRNSRFEVTTPDAVTGVRGTIFQVSHQDETEVKVYEGVVKVNSRTGSSSRGTFLNRGNRLQVSRSRNAQMTRFDPSQKPDFTRRISRKNLANQQSTSNRARNFNQEMSQMRNLQSQLSKEKDSGFSRFLGDKQGGNQGRGFGQAARAGQLGGAPSQNQISNARDQRGYSIARDIQKTANPGEDPRFNVFKKTQVYNDRDILEKGWKDSYRQRFQRETRTQREKVAQLGGDFQKNRQLLEKREAHQPVDLKSQVRQEDFIRRKNDGGLRTLDEKLSNNREILNLRKFKNSQQLDRKRIELERSKIERDKLQLVNKIATLERSLKTDDRREDLQAALVALKVQKRDLESQQRNVNTKLQNINTAIRSSDNRLNQVLSGFSSQFVKDDQFSKDSRRKLTR